MYLSSDINPKQSKDNWKYVRPSMASESTLGYEKQSKDNWKFFLFSYFSSKLSIWSNQKIIESIDGWKNENEGIGLYGKQSKDNWKIKIESLCSTNKERKWKQSKDNWKQLLKELTKPTKYTLDEAIKR